MPPSSPGCCWSQPPTARRSDEKAGCRHHRLRVCLSGSEPSARAHEDPDTPAEIATHIVAFNTAHADRAPEYATNCRYTIRSSRTSAVGICYNWSGSGNYKFQIAALMFDGCKRYMWYYGNVGWPYIQGRTSTGKWSYVYSPGGTWRIVAAKVVIWKP